jgi:hypothetical protein
MKTHRCSEHQGDDCSEERWEYNDIINRKGTE